MSRVAVRALWSPKDGSSAPEWEDACAYSEERGRIAVADGASSSYRAHEWATDLVESFVAGSPAVIDPEPVRAWMRERSQAWDGRADVGDNSAWYVEEAASRGSFATMLVLEISEASPASSKMQWRACAVGDTCVFHVRGTTLLASFPIDEPEKFNSTPPLVASEPRFSELGLAAVTMVEGVCEPGDLLLIASDALSAWSLRAAREDARVWSLLAGIDAVGFEALLAELRSSRAIENDDVTLARCRVT